VLHGCLPVQIGDNITDKFETILDWDSFTTRIPEADIERVPEILLRYTDEQVSLLYWCNLGRSYRAPAVQQHAACEAQWRLASIPTSSFCCVSVE
jgi:hypothetical protein